MLDKRSFSIYKKNIKGRYGHKMAKKYVIDAEKRSLGTL